MPKHLSLQKIVGYTVLALFCFISLLPLWVAFKTAITWPNDVFPTASQLGLGAVTWGNFARVLGLPSEVVLTSSTGSPINFLLALRNSVIYTALLVAGRPGARRCIGTPSAVTKVVPDGGSSSAVLMGRGGRQAAIAAPPARNARRDR